MVDTNLLIFDCETTAGGDGPECEPIEVSYYLMEQDLVKTFFMKPEVPCLACATVIHGLTQKDIDELDPIADMILELYEAFKEDIDEGTYVLAYNAPFDIGCVHRSFDKYLGKRFAPKRVLDILRLAQKLIPKESLGNHRLDTVYYFLFPDKLGDLMKAREQHSGAVDVKLEGEVFLGLWERAVLLLGKELSIEELVEYANRPELIDKWPFGKHADALIADVVKKDKQYIKWFLKQEWAEDWVDLVFTLSDKYEIQS